MHYSLNETIKKTNLLSAFPYFFPENDTWLSPEMNFYVQFLVNQTWKVKVLVAQ